MAKKAPPMAVVPFRLPADLVRRLDAVVRRMRAAQPGVTITRGDVARLLLTRGLVEEEKGRRSGHGDEA